MTMTMKKRLPLLMLLISLTGMLALAQIAQPYLSTTTPIGGRRGEKVTIIVEGFNLTGATSVLWEKPGVEGTIILNAETAREIPGPSTDPTKRYQGDRGVRNRLQIEVRIAATADPGEYLFRLVTPLGTTNTATFIVGALPETPEVEPNDSPSEARAITIPTTLIGEMQQVGDQDYFRFSARAGQELVFEVVASTFGSRFDGVLTLLDADGKTIASTLNTRFRRDALLAHRFTADGQYLLRLADYEKRGMGKTNEFAYRLNIGELPVITGWFPLGLRQGTTATLALSGFNLGRETLTVAAPAIESWNPTLPLRLDRRTDRQVPSNLIKIPLGNSPEIVGRPGASSMTAPEVVTPPVIVNGRIDSAPAEDWYRFSARKGQRLLIEIGAQRYGSPLDSVIEILDSAGRPVPRALLRCLLETSQTLNDRDSASRGIRLLSWSGIQPDDYLLIGNELLQVDVLPKGPDEDTFFKQFNGQRLGFLDTTPESHAVNTPIYKVSIHPPDATLPPNGLPQVRLGYRNDDGGPMYGKDSRLTFTAPADGDYFIRLRDVRGLHGPDFAYRLTIREPAPDFSLTIDPENPNLPRGSSIPVNVTAFRAEGFTGEIEVRLTNLPAGFSASPAIIREGVNTATILLRAAPDAAPGVSFPLRVEGRAAVAGRTIVRHPMVRERLAVVTVTPDPELLVWIDQPTVRLEPGGTALVNIRIRREKEFKGRIPFDIRNLPHGVIVRDVGLNGVLITEDETTQRFELSAEPWTRPVEQPIIVVGRIETASPQRSEFPASPFALIVAPAPSAPESKVKAAGK